MKTLKKLTASAGLGIMSASAFAQEVSVAAESVAPGGISDSTVQALWWIAPIAAICSLFFAFFFYKKMMSSPEGNDTMKEIAGHVRDGAYAYLYSQYKVVGLVFVVLLIIFTALAFFGIQNPFVPVAFLTGGFFSGLCGFLGMKTATNASARTAAGA